MVRILETTLRDGSYAIDFGFTTQDVKAICGALENAGFDLIEIGHGVGLGASDRQLGKAAETDEDYLAAAAGTLKRAKFGMFCIPGIARLEDIDLAAKYGMGFIRIGTNVTEVEASQKFIERARKHGMFVCANFMKSYALEPAEFAKKVVLSQKYGAEVVYVVDSSGGMMPNDVAAYFSAIQEICDVPLGFHAHENLGLGMANTLRAIEMGASIVDSSLQGMGRSSGNPPTEMLVSILKRLGKLPTIDPIEVMDIGELYIRPLMRKRGHSSLDIVSGMAQFHSSYMNVIRKYSAKYRVDPRRLILAVCEINRLDAPPDLVDQIAQQLDAADSLIASSRFEFDTYFGNEQNR